MASLKQLQKDDILFVAGETDNVYHHTAGLVILDTSDCPEFDFDHFKSKTIERIRKVPHFRWKLHEVPMGLDLPYWVEDENFSYDNHIRRIAVPSPGDREALAEVAAYLHSGRMNRDKPLWELWFIEGLEGGRCAILQKLHHCMMDGQGAMKLGQLLCDLEPGAEPLPMDKTITSARAGSVPEWWRQSAATALHLARFPGAAYREVFGLLAPKLRNTFGGRDQSGREKAETPVACFNDHVGSERGFVFSSVSLERIKTVKNAFDVTVNDVVLALVGTSMRSYLQRRDELPQLSLRAGVAVSLRSDEDDEFSNHVTQAGVTLATDTDDLVRRIESIHGDGQAAKEMARAGGHGVIEVVQILPPILVNAMMHTTTPEQALQMIGANMVVSNIRGSDVPLYIAGARMETMYPMSIITEGMGINFTCVSFAGHVDFGVIIDPRLVPDPWEIVDGLDAALQAYLALAKKSGSRRKTRGGGKTAAKRKAAPRRKAPAKKKSPAKKKAPAKKKSAAGKRAPAKKQRAVTGGAASRRRAAPKNKAAARRKAGAKKPVGRKKTT
ncbi:MAG: wax ester/triacylglycerol synthase family O-acyltransferase [Halioglobus sp.]|nr:wax ester/triacylglycerol synthase family O-acyltransferase [Halioglobus sp.]